VTQKIVIAPDKFKGSLTAAQAARAIARGVRRAVPHCEIAECPMADGGEGTVDVFLSRGASRRTAKVHGPRGAVVEAVYAMQGETAILEMAGASGLQLLQPEQRDPACTDTFEPHRRYRDEPGAGAAGGVGFALMAFLGARVTPGAHVVARAYGLDELLDSAALCMTGEGRIDSQTLDGKVVYRVAQMAHAKGVPAIAFGGRIDPQAARGLEAFGVRAIPISSEGMSTEESVRLAEPLLERAAFTRVRRCRVEREERYPKNATISLLSR
jgi:glycerate kinase